MTHTISYFFAFLQVTTYLQKILILILLELVYSTAYIFRERSYVYVVFIIPCSFQLHVKLQNPPQKIFSSVSSSWHFSAYSRRFY